MMSEKFTQGEWFVDGECFEGDATAGYGVSCEGRFIAFVSSWDDRGEPSKPQPQDLINAHLIAAAPEMYRMLEGFAEVIALNGELATFDGDDMEGILSLLAKARGEHAK